MKIVINIANDFSRYPLGRTPADSDFSGETLRKYYLAPALRCGFGTSIVEVELDGTCGYASSFLEEAFGGLVRVDGFYPSVLDLRLRLISENIVLTTLISRIYHAEACQ